MFFGFYMYFKYLSIHDNYTMRNIRRIVFLRECFFLITNFSLINHIYSYHDRKEVVSGTCNNLVLVNLVYYCIYMYLPTLILLLLLCFFLPRVIRMRRQTMSNLDQDKINKNLPSMRCTQEYSGECCTICLEDFTVGDHLRKMNCDHIFHKDCIDDWLIRNNSCPICREKAIDDKNSALDSV